jgi:hypothetical protein
MYISITLRVFRKQQGYLSTTQDFRLQFFWDELAKILKNKTKQKTSSDSNVQLGMRLPRLER